MRSFFFFFIFCNNLTFENNLYAREIAVRVALQRAKLLFNERETDRFAVLREHYRAVSDRSGKGAVIGGRVKLAVGNQRGNL